MSFLIRPATEHDLPEIQNIYNAEVLHGMATWNEHAYDLAHFQKQLTEVRYNTAVRVVEVQEALEKLDIEDFKKHMQTTCLKRLEQEHGIQTESIELQFAELSLVFAQLRNFYEHAAKHTYAVISVTSDNLVPTSLI